MNPQERAIGAYLGLAVGDALGATVEFMTPREIKARHGLHREIIGGGWLNLPRGRVTDDTGMALALGEAVLERDGVESETVARAFDRWMRSRPVDIGNTVRRGIVRFRSTGEAQVPPDEFDGGNGACMRLLPVALWGYGRDPDLLCAAVVTQAHVTHNSPLSDAGSCCVAEMIRMALEGASLLDLLHGPVARLTTTFPAFKFRPRRRENPSGFIVDTLQVVFQSLFDTESLEACLVEAVNRGGDADTTGAIAGMVAGALYGPAALPERWLAALDEATKAQCIDQARRLMALQS